MHLPSGPGIRLPTSSNKAAAELDRSPVRLSVRANSHSTPRLGVGDPTNSIRVIDVCSALQYGPDYRCAQVSVAAGLVLAGLVVPGLVITGLVMLPWSPDASASMTARDARTGVTGGQGLLIGAWPHTGWGCCRSCRHRRE